MLPQLANTYTPSKDYKLSQWLASPKLDGVRALYIPGGGLFSRSQKSRYIGFGSIESICLSICHSYNFSFIDGDIISGIVRKSKKYDVDAKARVEFKVFAVGSTITPKMKADHMYDLIISTMLSTGKVSYLSHSYIQNTPSVIYAEIKRRDYVAES